MTTLLETLERIRELDPKLAKCSQFAKITGTNSAICIPKHRWWSFNGVPSDNRHEFREKMLDWLTGQGCHLMSLHNPGCRRWDEMSLDFHGVWQHEDPAQTNCESELHALALCVLKVLENSLDNAPRSPVDER